MVSGRRKLFTVDYLKRPKAVFPLLFYRTEQQQLYILN